MKGDTFFFFFFELDTFYLLKTNKGRQYGLLKVINIVVGRLDDDT
jgi:hypothetical protein